ncbi:hypothetical protein N7453_010362 [Penicillium expansum]|nr:hypothetical protein N7453_010362 [Penicillium expansum]
MLAALRNLPIYEDLNRGIAFVGFTSSLGALGFGYNNGWWGGALGISEFKRKYGSYNSALDEWSIASENLSVGTGTGSAGFLVLSLLVMLGFVLEASTVMFLLDRWLSVESLFILALDLLQMLFPLIHLSVRGVFLALYSFFTSLGVFIATLVVYLSRNRTDKWQYLY